MPDESSSAVVSGSSGPSPSSPASTSSNSNRSSPPTESPASTSGGQAVSKKSQQQQQQLNGGIESKTLATTPTSVITNVNAAAARLNMLDNEDSWHIRYRSLAASQGAGMNDENPLTTATAAMLNLNGNDEHPHTMGLSSIYDYYKIPGMDKKDIWHSDASMEVSTIKMAGTNGQSHHRTLSYHKSQSNPSQDRHSPDHPHRPSHHSSPSSDADNSPHSTSPMSHAVVSSSTYSHSVKQESDGSSVIMKQEHHELPPIHQAAFGVAYGNYQAVPYVTTLSDTQTVLLQAANGEYYRTPLATSMDYGYGFQTRGGQGGGHFQDPTEQMLMERYRQATAFSQNGINPVVTHSGLSGDLPSPDSGLGEALASREHAAQQMYEYNTNDMHGSCVSGSLMSPTTSTSDSPRLTPTPNNRRNSSVERTPVEKLGSANPVVNIPKVFSNVGFRYYLESPISTSQKREEDRITYINKGTGQFYPITLEYIPDPDKPLKSQTVKSTIMLVFREEKTSEEEAKAWQFWHSRQHSIKQRIFDADTKNSQGLVGCIEETSHNAISVYWNPHEGHAKVNIAVQCLSTDFSNQKGVKGLPLHVQIDTHEDPRAQGKPVHRGYCQIKVFCDKGAERKTRDEERRAAKRKMAAAGRKKLDDMYHPVIERSEFYSMADLNKPPLLFTPADDLDRLPPMELSCFSVYNNPDSVDSSSKPERDVLTSTIVDNVLPPAKRLKTTPPVTERVMLYVRKDSDEAYTALHLIPPTLKGLAQALYLKYGIDPNKISKVYKKNFKGLTVEMDDDMLSFYSNEDSFTIDIHHTLSDDGLDTFSIVLTEIIPDTRPTDVAHSSLNGTSD